MNHRDLATKPNKQSRTEIIFDDGAGLSEGLDFKFAVPASKSGKGDNAKSIYDATRYEFFFLHPNHPFNEQEKEQLKKLLFSTNIIAEASAGKDYDAYHSQAAAHSSKGRVFYVAPRRGTHSPWSSKTQDILKDIFPSLKDWDGGRLIERGYEYALPASLKNNIDELKGLVFDKMTQEILSEKELEKYFIDSHADNDLRVVNMDDLAELQAANREWGLAISPDEIEYLREVYRKLERSATDAELMLFAQLNSEHCRHKIFNAVISSDDSVAKSESQNGHKPTMFGLIKKTSRESPAGLVSAYTDNAAIFATAKISAFNRYEGDSSNEYQHREQKRHLIFKAETHNHPTFVSPFPGAATGVGGEIRDELACGIGGRTKAGFAGFSVSDLLLDSNNYTWEQDFGCPFGKASAKQIMLEAPLGSSHYANEFGRPTLAGYFRTLSCERNGIKYGYHKPIMLAGGWGEISYDQAIKPEEIDGGAHLVLMGEPALRIGIGGGSTSSLKSSGGKKNVELDFASVQRDNAETEKRCAEAIEACSRQGKKNPIVFIHDLGAGGLGNAVAELLKDGNCGGEVELSKIPVADPSMSPAEVWSNESQERFLLAVDPERLDEFDKICQRENAPYKVIGTTNKSGANKKDTLRLGRLEQLGWEDNKDNNNNRDNHDNQEDSQNTDAINLPLEVLFPKTPKEISVSYIPVKTKGFESPNISEISEYAEKVLQLPAVASKGFLITIGDRFVGGLTAREQMVGPWQVPINDYAATLADFSGFGGEAAAIGERTPLAILNPKAAVRMALAEVITNLAASGINKLQDIKLCANWMAASNEDGQMANLYEGVRTLTEEMCQSLGLAIPVGKDSLFMSASWDKQNIISPLSLIMSGLAPLADVRLGVDPLLQTDTYKNISGDEATDDDNSLLQTDTYKNTGADNSLLQTDTYKNMLPSLWLVSIRHGSNRLGGSALAQVMQQWEGETADIESPKDIANFFSFVSGAVQDKLLLAYHDVSDGGLWTTLSEMAFASNCGLSINLAEMMKQQQDEYTALFGEEAGAVIQVAPKDEDKILERGRRHNLTLHKLGVPINKDKIEISCAGRTLIDKNMSEMRSLWNKVSDNMRKLRDDNPQCVKQESCLIEDFNYKGIQESIKFDVADKYLSIKLLNKSRPKVAILRTQGVNSNIETALAFHNAGFEAVDVHINDLKKDGSDKLKDYKGAVFCGGFTYGDALGAGVGWVASILYNPKLKEEFEQFFQREDTFTLGICNGCQVLARLQEIIDGADWNCRFQRNESRRFEARTVMVKICKSPSIFFTGMEGSVIPVASAHGEGKATFASSDAIEQVLSNEQAAMVYTDGVYTDGQGNDNPAYPLNPNGSAHGIAGMTSKDGRVTLLMPHPERTLRRVNQCWHDKSTTAIQRKAEVATPWQAMFYNARLWVS